MNTQTESPAHLGRYDRVDVLALLDPNWLENSQAATLARMCREVETDSDQVERGVAVLAA
jgi:hypothetical protein